MIPETVWVKVEVEGEEGTRMERLRPGDSYVAILDVHIPAGIYLPEQIRTRRIRISVPQEGVKPLDPPPWENE